MSASHRLSDGHFEDYDPLSDYSSDNIQPDFNNVISSFSSDLSIIEDDQANPNNNLRKNSSFSEEQSFIQSARRKKRKKSDLNKTPLPIFSCIYCSNERIAFNHLSLQLISEKYLYGTSPCDIQLMNKLASHEGIFCIENEYPHIFNALINNSEYLTKYISLQTSKSFLNTKVNLSFEHLCSLNNKRHTHRMLRKAEMFVNKKKHINIGLNSVMKNNNTNNTKYNLLLNNYKLNVNSTNSNSNENNNNSSSFNCNSISLNYNTVDNKESNLNKGQLGIIGLDNIVEKIENVDDSDECEEEDFFNFLRFDLKRKIHKKDIEWENICYNIWQPELSDDEIE